jgi:hypothetical protein
MERTTNIEKAKEILGENYIGHFELESISDNMAMIVPSEAPPIPFSSEELKNRKDDYILILGSSKMQNGEPLTLKSLRSHFGINPEISEPCFYNQDWYLEESFFEKPLEINWFLIRKKVFQESRMMDPEEIIKHYDLPSAILCAYTFFVTWFYSGESLWSHDFVWCNDFDHSGDRIYVGKYHDLNGINKNGFSIHRHLRIKSNYGAIEAI